MEWLSSPVFFFLTLGVALIAFEILIMQLSTFWFLYIGLGAIVASLFVWLFPGLDWAGGVGVFVVGTIALTLVLNRPLKKWQQEPGKIAGNDAIGQKVEVIETVSTDSSGKVLWSGSDWQAELAESEESAIEVGQSARIVSIEGITLTVGR